MAKKKRANFKRHRRAPAKESLQDKADRYLEVAHLPHRIEIPLNVRAEINSIRNKLQKEVGFFDTSDIVGLQSLVKRLQSNEEVCALSDEITNTETERHDQGEHDQSE